MRQHRLDHPRSGSVALASQLTLFLAVVSGCFALSWPAYAGSSSLAGMIVYNRYDASSGQPVAQLWAIRPDGTDDHRLTVNLPEPGFPEASPDGQLLGLSSADPNNLDPYQRDVFVLAPDTGQLTRISGLPLSTFPVAYQFYKAFSPDDSEVAVASFNIIGGTGVQTNKLGNVTNVTTGAIVFPMLQVFNRTPASAGAAPVTVMLGLSNEGLNHGGDGVAWSPTGNRLVYPVRILVPYTNSVTESYVTALYLLDPVSNAATQGNPKQLTFPSGRVNGLFEPAYVAWEDDFQPAFSPNGKLVAYVRDASTLTAPPSPPVFGVPSIRIVNTDGSNDHQVVQFAAGSYISHVSWSPDGTQLVFDLGKQAADQTGEPESTYEPMTMELYIVNADGTGLRKLASAAAAFPAWWPTAAQTGATNHPPQLQAVAAQTVAQGAHLAVQVQASDPDAGQTLQFSLDAGAPAGATIDPTTGLFSWTPPLSQPTGNVSVTVQVTDDGQPPLSASETFQITVTPAASLRLSAARAGGFVQLEISGAHTNDTVRIEASSNLVNWTPVATLVQTGQHLSFVDPDSQTNSVRFYRALVP